MCVANSARSQMAEGIAKTLYPNIEFQSAGSMPSRVNPFAIEVMKEIHIDISDHYSKSFENLDEDFINNLDYVIPLCKEEVCPILNSDAIILPLPFEDPASDKMLKKLLKDKKEVKQTHQGPATISGLQLNLPSLSIQTSDEVVSSAPPKFIVIFGNNTLSDLETTHCLL